NTVWKRLRALYVVLFRRCLFPGHLCRCLPLPSHHNKREGAMRWFWLLACVAPWSAQADTIYLCKAYSGGMFWSSASCSQQKATLDRAVSVPDNMPWDQKVAMGEAAWAQVRAVAAPPPQAVVIQQQNPQASRQAECESLRDSIANLDSQARQPQSGQMQDWLKQRRRELSDQRYRMQC
ncbi:MAG: hypothetical protein KGL99_08980, partial [Burkholderiales bacterium]|nr:hypothetical protein [Burkholderiales bacterium]